MSLKGNAVNERSLIMRLHLLQAIMCFHQNQRNEAYRLIQTAELEWDQLQVNDQMVQSLAEMGKILNFNQFIYKTYRNIFSMIAYG